MIAEWMRRRATRRAAEDAAAYRAWLRAVETNQGIRCAWCQHDLSESDLDRMLVSWETFGGQQHTYLICARCWNAQRG